VTLFVNLSKEGDQAFKQELKRTASHRDERILKSLQTAAYANIREQVRPRYRQCSLIPPPDIREDA
jgi:hypothetical protein